MSDTQLRIIGFEWKSYGIESRYIPYVKIYDKNSSTISDISLENYNFNWKLTDEKVCIGRHEEGQYITCTNTLKRSSDSTVRCDGCVQKDQFYNSFFKKAKAFGENKKYLESLHFVYLAYFPYKRIKVGTASKLRGALRLIEQDAFIYSFIADTSDAYEAQELESLICKQANIPTSITSQSKLKNIHLRPSMSDATVIINDKFKMVKKHLGHIDKLKKELNIVNLLETNNIYFPDYQIREVTLSTNLCGFSKGLRGRYLLLENNRSIFAFDTNYLLGRNIESYIDSEIRYNQGSSNQLLLGI